MPVNDTLSLHYPLTTFPGLRGTSMTEFTQPGEIERDAAYYRDGWLTLTRAIRDRQAMYLGDDSERYHLCQFLAVKYGLEEAHPLTEPSDASPLQMRKWLLEHATDQRHVWIPVSWGTIPPPITAIEFSETYRGTIVKLALLCDDLTDALAIAAYWIAHALQAVTSLMDLQGAPFSAEVSEATYQAMIRTVRDAWIAQGKPVSDFMPNFNPPSPPPPMGV